jgi:hypothetical protein
MSLLKNVIKGKIKEPYFLLVYGPEGVGKSTFASKAPSTVWIDLEKGSSELDVERIPGFAPEDEPTMDHLHKAIDELLTEEHPYKTLVIDSLSKLEPIIQKQVVANERDKDIKSIEDIPYGKGIPKTIEAWQDFMIKLSRVQAKMNVILIGHSLIKKFDNPQTNSGAYDRFQLSIREKAADVVKASVKAVLFATEEISTKTDKNKKVRAYGDGTRVIYTERRPQFDAKNRLGVPFQLPLDWEEFDKAAQAGNPDAPEAIRERIQGMLSVLHDKDITEKVEGYVKDAGEDGPRLAAIENKLKIRMGEEDNA